MEPLISGREACRILGPLKGAREIGHAVLCRLVLQEGLPAHPDPFGGPHQVFLRSEVEAWYESRLSTPLRQAGRPRKSPTQKGPAGTGPSAFVTPAR